MSTPITKVTLVGGSGRLGPHILSALQSHPQFSTTVITRQTSSSTFPPGTNVVRVADSYPQEEMVSAFRGQDAVVLCLGYGGDHHHKSLAETSIKAGVRRFIANGYGGADRVFPIAKRKAEMVGELKELEKGSEGWSWSQLVCGLFFDFCIKTDFFGINPSEKTGRILGNGDSKFSVTNLATIGQAVAKILLHSEETANRCVYISSFETTLHQILDAEKKIVGADGWDVEYALDIDDVITSATKDLQENGNMLAMAKLAIASCVKEGIGADFKERDVLDNNMLDLKESESVEETVAMVLREELGIKRGVKEEFEYFFKDTGVEIARLTYNHEITMDALGHEFVPVPKDFWSAPRTVLDSATADGLWLRDFAASLPTPATSTHTFTGTDINAADFPASPPPSFSYAIQDVNKSWPESWTSTFDLVHQRLGLASSGPRTQTVVQNMGELVKPGGWIVFEEPDDKIDETAGPGLRKMILLMKDMVGMMGSKWGVANDIAGWLRSVDFVDVRERGYELKYGAKNKDGELARKGVKHNRLTLEGLTKIARDMPPEKISLSREELDSLVEDVVAEAETKGHSFFMRMVWGRKPE